MSGPTPVCETVGGQSIWNGGILEPQWVASEARNGAVYYTRWNDRAPAQAEPFWDTPTIASGLAFAFALVVMAVAIRWKNRRMRAAAVTAKALRAATVEVLDAMDTQLTGDHRDAALQVIRVHILDTDITEPKWFERVRVRVAWEEHAQEHRRER